MTATIESVACSAASSCCGVVNEIEACGLAVGRGTLLPKLISGELRVKGAGRIVWKVSD